MACLRKSLIATVAYFCFSTEFQFPLSKMVEKLPVCIEQCPLPPPHKIHVLSGPPEYGFLWKWGLCRENSEDVAILEVGWALNPVTHVLTRRLHKRETETGEKDHYP